ncbi:MAG: pentapeptide repeat-containing protein [Terriglobales bacterium]
MNHTGDFRKRDFSGQNLAGAHFRDADLYQAAFAGASLEGAIFENCFAAEASFEQARCARLRAANCSFYRASFRGAELDDALLWMCVLAGADLRGASLKHVTLTLDCNSFEEIQVDRATGAKLAYLFGRARSPQRKGWLDVVGETYLTRMSRVFGT